MIQPRQVAPNPDTWETGTLDFMDLLEQLRPPWMRRGSCRDHSELTWFPEHGAPGNPTAAAIAICRLCLVRTDCLTYAVDRPELRGIWGGESERGRERLRGHAR